MIWTKSRKEPPSEELLEKPKRSSQPCRRGKPSPVLVIHGGAGLLLKKNSAPAQRELYKDALRQALLAGNKVLQSGGLAMDAVVAAVTVMEDCPLFNAAHGAVFNVAGKNELEASIMVSQPPLTHPSIPASRKGFSVSLLTRAKNPSQVARALYLEPTLAPHAFLSGATAEEIGDQVGQELVDPSYFWTEHRWREHRRGLGLPENPFPGQPNDKIPYPPLDQLPTGTVGAVALDIHGHIACCTSTGGKTNKLVGRIGDTPSMGSGFWAETWTEPRRGLWAKFLRLMGKGASKSRAVGVSGTGDGDYFIREATAVTIARRMQYQGQSLRSAAHRAVEDLRRAGGMGGVIALDDMGNG
ncbi:Beta-aspartyl-peptidase (threonine type) [Ceratobasidium theobromae]|uniref:Beta-aspartyl-peptidase (Threonine type) n=1 Tax=Ceratobasidium theobromae TaxID=1582974 RepID=A0A5N5QWS4_9AGAM|nr:Beta-aspartyl-peptidase (threonine type) [Ceratobasidium theobromae]